MELLIATFCKSGHAVNDEWLTLENAGMRVFEAMPGSTNLSTTVAFQIAVDGPELGKTHQADIRVVDADGRQVGDASLTWEIGSADRPGIGAQRALVRHFTFTLPRLGLYRFEIWIQAKIARSIPFEIIPAR